MPDSFNEIQVRVTSKIPIFENKCLAAIPFFLTGKGIKLEITKQELIDSLGDPRETINEKGYTILSYRIDNYEQSDFLKHYNLPCYYGKYIFKNNKLIEFAFGFEYP